MKKIYIVLVIVFIAVAACFIYLGTSSHQPQTQQEINTEIRKELRNNALKKVNMPKIHRQMDKDTLKRLIMMKSRHGNKTDDEGVNNEKTEKSEKTEKND